MEQQRIFVIIVSVSLFVAVVIGAALLLTYPRDDEDAARAQGGVSDSADEFDPIEYLNQPDEERTAFEPEEERDPDSEDVIIVYGPSERESDDDARREDRAPERDIGARRSEERRDPETARRPAPRAAEQAAERRAAPTREEQERVDEEVTREHVASRRVERDAAPERPDPAPDAAVSSGTSYWVQAISSPNLGLVREAKTTLEENRLGSRITSTSVDGENYFRLRVGPFINKGEAEKFLGWVQEIDGFEGSYISETYFRM